MLRRVRFLRRAPIQLSTLVAPHAMGRYISNTAAHRVDMSRLGTSIIVAWRRMGVSNVESVGVNGSPNEASVIRRISSLHRTRYQPYGDEPLHMHDFLPESSSAHSKLLGKKRSALAITFRRYRDVEPTESMEMEGRRLLDSIGPADIARDVNFACLYLNASRLFEAPARPAVVDHIVRDVLPFVKDGSQLAVILSGVLALRRSASELQRRRVVEQVSAEQPPSVMRLATTTRSIADDFDADRDAAVESPHRNDSVPPPETDATVDSSPPPAAVQQAASLVPIAPRAVRSAELASPTTVSTVEDPGLSVTFEEGQAIVAAALPIADNLLGDLPKDAVVHVACYAVDYDCATPRLLRGVCERVDMVLSECTVHDIAQLVLAFGISSFRSVELTDSVTQWMKQFVKNIDFAWPNDLAAAFYGCALLQVATEDIIEACGRRLFSLVLDLDAVAMAQTLTALAILGTKAPKLTKAIGEQFKVVDLSSMSALVALDAATALALLGGGDDESFAALTGRIMTQRHEVLANSDTRQKLLSLTALIGERESDRLKHTPLWQMTDVDKARYRAWFVKPSPETATTESNATARRIEVSGN